MSTQRQLNDGARIAGTPYRVIRLLGSGGMGCVYEVEHEELGKRFVLKALLRDLASRADLVQRMRTEWRSLGRLEHPNIVRVSDAGLADGTLPYYVMERLRGVPLSEALKRRGRFPIEEALGIAIAVLDGLAAAHEIGIVHRDVKPPNIFLCTDGVPRLLDFGIAKLLDASAESITAKGVAVGTPRYMSPEQAAGDPVDARADLYAVGLVLFEMITGVGPYKAADANELFLAHLAQLAPPISTRVRGITPELDALVAGLLAKSPKDRPVGAAAAAQSLRAALELQRSSTTTLPERVNAEGASAKVVGIGPVSERELPTLIGDVQRLLECETRHVGPVKRVERAGPPPLPKAISSARLEPVVEAQLDRTSEHTLFLNELPLAASEESTLTSVAAAGLDPQTKRRARLSTMGRWLFPLAVIGVAAVALVLSSSSPPVETGVVQIAPKLSEVPASSVPGASSEQRSPVVSLEAAVAPDAGRSHLRGLGPVEPDPVSATVAPQQKLGAARRKLPNSNDFAASVVKPKRAEASTTAPKSGTKIRALPPSGL